MRKRVISLLGALSLAAYSCGGAPESKTPDKAAETSDGGSKTADKKKTRLERLERFHSRAKVVAEKLDAMGFRVRPSEVTLLLGGAKQDEKILTASTLHGSRSSSRTALAAFRHLLGLDKKVEADKVFVGAVTSELWSVSTYYDSVGQYVVFREATIGNFSYVDELVAHGLAHAHQDQAQGGIEAFLSVNSNTLDRARAARAVLEGEAGLIAAGLELARWKRDLKDLDISLEDGGLDYGLADEGDVLIANSGKRFALEQFRRGGWPAVRETFQKPPESTEQLLHPDKYGADTPQIVTLPTWPDPAALVKQTASDVLGELMLFGTLAQSFGYQDDPTLAARDEAELASIGWDGDRIEVYELPDGDHAALFRSVWDLEDAARDFARVFEKALEKNEADRDTVSIVQRGLVVDVALSEDTDLLPALTEALAKHPVSFAQNPEDAKSTLLAEEAVRKRARQRPHIESGHWVHPASALTVALPDDDWGILLFGGRQIVTDDIYDPEALILSSRSQDFQDGDLRAYMEDADTLYFKNPRFAQIEAERRTVLGTEVGVVTVLVAKEKDDDLSFRFRTWIVPRSGHYFWLTALVPSDDWDDAAPVFEDIERGIRFVPAAH